VERVAPKEESSQRGSHRHSQRTPAPALLLGLVITLAAVVAYASYIAVQLSGLRRLQSELVDRNRKDSLQLLRIQNDLNSVALAMRDMLDTTEPYPLTAWNAQFERIQQDLDKGLQLEESLASVNRTPEQRRFLSQSMGQFWDAVERMFKLAEGGKDAEAREQIRLSLQSRQQALSTAVSRLLVENNEGEQQAAQRIADIYNRVQKQSYFFLGATLITIVLTSSYLIRSNKIVFARLADLSNQRSELAQKLISTQESTLRHISRELHDEFGQILTAIGSMLRRAGNRIPIDSTLQKQLEEVQEIAQKTLSNIRTLSQALHPVLLEEAGLESTLDWYLPSMERQTGIKVHYEKTGASFPLETSAGVHIYRVVQEALNNVTRHSGASEAWVRLKFSETHLAVEVEDHGKGFFPDKTQRGIGLVAMRERAELIGGTILVTGAGTAGTIVRLSVPRGNAESNAI
jgi:signal transduction histidine kinase